jgi:hypothetical protein
VIDLRDSEAAGIHAVVAEHDPECDADHGDTRYIFANREFIDDAAYERLWDLGYRDYPVVDFVRYPGAEGVLKVLGLLRVHAPCASGVPSPRDRWRDVLCLRHQQPSIEIGELIEAEDAAFGRDALKIPEVIGTATGPIPRPDASMPGMD